MKFLRSFVEREGLSFGIRRKLSVSRRFIVDYLHFAHKVPSQAIYRDIDVNETAKLRDSAGQRIGWAAIFMKSFAVMTEDFPDLRAFFMTLPWGQLYEHPHNIGRVAVTREHEGEEWVFFARLERPETMSLAEIQSHIHEAQTRPVDKIPLFKLQVWFSKLPKLLRRGVFWSVLNLSGGLRAGLTGTYALSSVASMGAVGRHPPSLGNMVMSYSPINKDGVLRMTFVYDHRIFDGRQTARFLEVFESVLNNQIAAELKSLRRSEAVNRLQVSTSS